jgi:methylase of polypeptide subunit release factors
MVLDDRFWDIYMRVYDLGVATPQPYQKLLDEVIGLLPKNLDHSVVVETGCGTGNVLKRLFVTHDPDTVYGLERNELALKIAQPKLQRARRNVTDHSD